MVRSSTNDIPSAEMYSTHLIRPSAYIPKILSEMDEPCGTPAYTECLSIALPSIIISTILSKTKLIIHHVRSPSMCLAFIVLIRLPFAKLGKAALISVRSMPVMRPFVQAAWALKMFSWYQITLV